MTSIYYREPVLVFDLTASPLVHVVENCASLALQAWSYFREQLVKLCHLCLKQLVTERMPQRTKQRLKSSDLNEHFPYPWIPVCSSLFTILIHGPLS